MRHSHFSFALLVLATALTGSCAPSLSKLEVKGAADLNCPQESVEWAALDNGGYRAAGCGREVFYHTVCHYNSCDYENVLTVLLGRASFAMACDAGALDIKYLDRSSYGISGCGKRLIF